MPGLISSLLLILFAPALGERLLQILIPVSDLPDLEATHNAGQSTESTDH